jgi:hypothetical protein
MVFPGARAKNCRKCKNNTHTLAHTCTHMHMHAHTHHLHTPSTHTHIQHTHTLQASRTIPRRTVYSLRPTMARRACGSLDAWLPSNLFENADVLEPCKIRIQCTDTNKSWSMDTCACGRVKGLCAAVVTIAAFTCVCVRVCGCSICIYAT